MRYNLFSFMMSMVGPCFHVCLKYVDCKASNVVGVLYLCNNKHHAFAVKSVFCDKP